MVPYTHYPNAAYVSKLANNLMNYGSGPDDITARIGRPEAALLKALGGSGQRDAMGMVHYANEGAQGSMGGGGTGGPGGGNAGANGGGGGMGGGGGAGGGGHGDMGGLGYGPTGLRGPLGPTGLAGQALNGGTFAGNPNAGPPTMGSDTSISHNVAASMGYTPDQFAQGATNLGQAVTDSYHNGPFSSFGAFAGNFIGLDQNLVNQPFGAYVNGLDKASWGFDPAGPLGSLLGMGIGAPLLGSATDALSSYFGRPMEVGLNGNPAMGYGPHGSGGAGGLVTGGHRW